MSILSSTLFLLKVEQEKRYEGRCALTICNLTVFPSNSIVRILKSTCIIVLRQQHQISKSLILSSLQGREPITKTSLNPLHEGYRVDSVSSSRLKRPQDHDTHPDGRDVTLGISIIRETKKKTGLSDTGVTDEEEL